jgi:hypothetical protein
MKAGRKCYAGNGHQAIHWRKIDSGERGQDWPVFVGQIAALPAGTLWRHNVAGDLPHEGGAIDKRALSALVAANAGKKGFTYTHHSMSKAANRRIVKDATAQGFTVNLSANNLREADSLVALAIAPVVAIVPSGQTTNTITPAGHKVVICPAAVRDGVTCQTCGLCARADRQYVIAFPAHGTGASAIDRDYFAG